MSAFGDGAGEVGNFASQFAFFGVEGFEFDLSIGGVMELGAAGDAEHFSEHIGDEHIGFEGVEDGFFERTPADASLGATGAAFGAVAAIGFVPSALVATGDGVAGER